MKLLRKIWFRIIISLLGGGMVTELIHITSGDPNRSMTTNYSLIFGLIIFGILTWIVKVDNRT